MRLTDIEFTRLLPQFMRNDKNAQAFAYAVQSKIIEVSLAITHAKLYSRIDSLTDEVLDELAWQFNIVEYRASYDISTKRELIKGCMALHYKRGTVKAVEDVTQKIFGEATVEEWFNYGGRPYHFKVYTSNPAASDEMLADLERVIKETQSIRSHLEEVVIELMQNMNLYIGCRVIIRDDISLQTIGVNTN